MSGSARESLEIQEPQGVAEGSNIDIAPNSLPMPLRVELLEYQLSMSELADRKQASTMLLFGAVSGFLGFALAFTLGVIKELPQFSGSISDSYCRTFDGKELSPCYFPSTVSEMVHDPEDPAGKIFFFFEFIGAILIFFSWYPTRLRKVYVGDDLKVPGLGVSWVSVRQYVPAPGMMMLAVIATVPFPQADLLDYFCITFHLFGAAFMFVGYFLVEAVTVGWGPFRHVAADRRHSRGRGLFLRRQALHFIIVTYAIFCILQVVLSTGNGEGWDEWEVPDYEQCKRSAVVNCRQPQLVRAAALPVKALKVLSYASEVVCGLALIFSHLIIWYFCEERHYDLPEELIHLSARQPEFSPELRNMMPRSLIRD